MTDRLQLGALCASVVLLLALAACFSPREAEVSDSRFLNLAPDVAYMGAAACESCHSEIYASYQGHGMAQSFYPMEAARAVEAFPSPLITHEASGYAYRAIREGDQFLQEEFRLGADGQPLSRQVRTMDYVVGSGTAARTYLTQDSTGRLYELPLTWYTQANEGAGGWAFSPGYEIHNGRFDRTIPERCMSCHNGVSEAEPFTDGRFTSLAEGIGCESCHGPGALHVEARTEDPEPADSVDATIVNPKWLDLDLRLDVCQQCHLSADVSILREGETATSYRPGRPLAAHRALFAPADADPNEVSVISHAERMMASACFQESAAMDCVTCHNPHAAVPSVETFSETCRSCHDTSALQARMPTEALRQQHAVDQTCVSCHMPKVEASDAPHASFTDHLIRVVDGEIEGVAAASEGGLRPVFPEDEGNAVAEGMAYVILGRQNGSRETMSRGARQLAAALDGRAEAGEAQYLLGFARLQLGQAREALEPLQRAVEIGANPERLNALAQAYEQTGQAAEVEALYRRALEMQPGAARIRVNLGRFLDAQGRTAEALAAYRQAVADEPWNATAHYNLGTAYARQGDLQRAIESLDRTVQLEPAHADALTNLGVLLAQAGDLEAASVYLPQAVLADPQNANAHANLALFFANVGRLNEAATHAQIALQIDPQQQTARQVLGAISGS